MDAGKTDDNRQRVDKESDGIIQDSGSELKCHRCNCDEDLVPIKIEIHKEHSHSVVEVIDSFRIMLCVNCIIPYASEMRV